jgi:calcineurin-like phosphoesterase
MNGALLEIDQRTGKATKIERISLNEKSASRYWSSDEDDEDDR